MRRSEDGNFSREGKSGRVLLRKLRLRVRMERRVKLRLLEETGEERGRGRSERGGFCGKVSVSVFNSPKA